jgi:TonB family protein
MPRLATTTFLAITLVAFSGVVAEAAPVCETAASEAQGAQANQTGAGQASATASDDSLKALQQKAHQGDADAEAHLGVRYYVGDGVPQDYKEAYRWFLDAGETGHVGAVYYLGTMCRHGEGLDRDLVEAYKWFAVFHAIGDFANKNANPTQGIEREMSSEQVSEARTRAEGWMVALEKRNESSASREQGTAHVARVKIDIRASTRTKNVEPVYPDAAVSEKVQGVVLIDAGIGPNGRVKDVHIRSSVPALDAAALDAVRQWEFTPTLLNGLPVPVEMTVAVRFSLK